MNPRDCVIGVLDYQAGNVQSIVNAFDCLGAATLRVESDSQLSNITHLVLPGVGAFGFCSKMLGDSGLLPAVSRWVLEEKKPTLGICVGMQLLADVSEEMGSHEGLGWCGGRVERLQAADPDIRVPHVGWNTVSFETKFGDFARGDSADFYFDHAYAYHSPTHADTVAVCSHGRPFCAVIRRKNLIAAQFHPEKSQTAGMRFLENFLAVGQDG